jgi:hypothetical protein
MLPLPRQGMPILTSAQAKCALYDKLLKSEETFNAKLYFSSGRARLPFPPKNRRCHASHGNPINAKHEPLENI